MKSTKETNCSVCFVISVFIKQETLWLSVFAFNVFNVSSMNFINPYIVENHAVEEALNVEEVGGRRESQRAIPNSEGRKPWI